MTTVGPKNYKFGLRDPDLVERALPYTKMVSFKIKHYNLLKSSMDSF
jgi:hypothetical protein